jgi:hypothetical protein
MQSRNITSVLFRSRRAAILAAAGTVVLGGVNVASAISLPHLKARPNVMGSFTQGAYETAMLASTNNALDPMSGGHASSDATKTYLGGAAGLFSSPTDWTSGPLLAGDSPTFAAAPAGNYTVTNDQPGLTYGDMILARGAPAPTVTLNGGYTGNRIEATTGTLVLNGGATNLNSDFPDDGTNPGSIFYSARIGVGAIGGGLTVQNNATVKYNDFLWGSASGNSTVLITGAGTTLTPFVTDGTKRADFRGGGAGTSTTTITNGATVTMNLMLPNHNETFTVSNGATLNANSYQTGGNFGGQIEVGYWDETVTPTALFNVNNGTVNTTFFTVGSGTAQNPTATISNGGKVNAPVFGVGDSVGAVGNVVVTGTGSFIGAADGVLHTGGATGGTDAGSANVTISAGATATFGQVQFDRASAALAGAGYTGTNFTVTGPGSVLEVVGFPAGVDPETDPAFGGNMFLGNAGGVKTSVTVSNGGIIDLISDDIDPNVNGALIAGTAANTVSNVTVDGADSLFSAGTFLQVLQRSATGVALTNGKATFNIVNGGQLQVIDDGSDFAGNAQIGLNFNAAAPSAGASVIINVGGGSGAADADSFFVAQGGMFLGNSGTTVAPIAGVPITMNVNNGAVQAGTVDVGPNTVINLNKGTVAAGLIAVGGGQIKISPTAAPGVGVLIADAYEVGSNGFIDIGKSGGVSVINTGDTDDLSSIKALIVAGLAGGNNSIKSSALTATSAIGYALRLPNDPLTSFLGITFDPADSAVLFRVTIKGDANLSGNVEFQDLVALAQNYNGTGKEWFNGDFDYDGDVDFQDLIPLAQNYNGVFSVDDAEVLGGGDFAADWLLAQSFVPEPASLSLLVAAAGVARRRRR